MTQTLLCAIRDGLLHAAAFSLAQYHSKHFNCVKIFGALRRDMVSKNDGWQLHVVVNGVTADFGNSDS
ncbi:MAG: hypothetical protein IPH31_04825 [Lewinellaceae bacterium]|nr:hypothetical protein [Lewinellaceae bacterium]